MEKSENTKELDLLMVNVMIKRKNMKDNKLVFMGIKEGSLEYLMTLTRLLADRLTNEDMKVKTINTDTDFEHLSSDDDMYDFVICVALNALNNLKRIILPTNSTVVLVIQRYVKKYTELANLADLFKEFKTTICGVVFYEVYKAKLEL